MLLSSSTRCALSVLLRGSYRVHSQPRWRLHHEHEVLDQSLDKLRSIADSLDDATGQCAVDLITDANRIVEGTIVLHWRGDETKVYQKLRPFLADSHGLSAMSRAHRE